MLSKYCTLAIIECKYIFKYVFVALRFCLSRKIESIFHYSLTQFQLPLSPGCPSKVGGTILAGCWQPLQNTSRYAPGSLLKQSHQGYHWSPPLISLCSDHHNMEAPQPHPALLSLLYVQFSALFVSTTLTHFSYMYHIIIILKICFHSTRTQGCIWQNLSLICPQHLKQ